MYTRVQKGSAVSHSSLQKKSENLISPRNFSVQTKPDTQSLQEQEMPSYSRAAADSLYSNVMRSMEGTGHSREIGIQRQCSECAKEEKDSDEMPSVAGVQAKLTVGAPGDRYEQEADRVAAQVMRMSIPPDHSPQVQRFGEKNNPVQRWSLAQSITPVVQRQVDEHLQMRCMVQRAFPAGRNQASGDLESRLNASKGGGSALAPEVRAFMEPRFGADFSSVRVHTGGEAVQMNRELGAQAFTHGSDVYFGAGKSPGNNELTAHELTHVIQQTGSGSSIQCLPIVISSVSQCIQKDDLSEAERVRKLNEDYENAVAAKDWQKSAELLNAFNREDILTRLSKLKRGQIGAIHQGALDNPNVGLNSQVAHLTRATYLDLNYENSKALEQWGNAAQFLNGFSDSDILARVKQLNSDQLPKLRQGALISMPGWSKRVTDIIDIVVAQSQASDKPVGEVIGDDTVDIKGEPVAQPNYIQNVVKFVGLPIWGGPFYFKRTEANGWGDSIVLQRDELKLNNDPLKDSSFEIKKVYKTRAAADKAVLSFGLGAYAYYIGQDGYIYPTIISSTTAPAMCGAAAMMVEQERTDAKAAANFMVELALWYAGARYPIETAKPAPKGLIMDAGATLSQDELRIVGKLLQEGRTVRVLAESTKDGVRTADFIVDGVKTELKTISNITGKDISGSLSRRILDGAGQAPHIIIDARGQTGLTAELASRAARRAYGFEVSKGLSRIQQIRFIGKGFDITIPRVP